MNYAENNTPPSIRLRMLFDNAVVMRKLTSGATYGDLAELWDDAKHEHTGPTVAIAVTLDPSLPLPSSWLFPSMAGAALCGAPSLSTPLHS